MRNREHVKSFRRWSHHLIYFEGLYSTILATNAYRTFPVADASYTSFSQRVLSVGDRFQHGRKPLLRLRR